jgi:hypothetical protein
MTPSTTKMALDETNELRRFWSAPLCGAFGDEAGLKSFAGQPSLGSKGGAKRRTPRHCRATLRGGFMSLMHAKSRNEAFHET